MPKIKILLVDDEERFLETTKKLMVRKGYEVGTAGGGADALEQLKTSLCDVVVLDVKMPGMDGVSVLKEVKRLYPLTEVIMLTGNATVESAIDGLKSGAFDYLMKPTDIEELAAKVEAAFEKKLAAEDKIREAQFRLSQQSPREILRRSQ